MKILRKKKYIKILNYCIKKNEKKEIIKKYFNI